MKIQIQIQQIDNGWLVQVPGFQNPMTGQMEAAPKAFSCENEEVLLVSITRLIKKDSTPRLVQPPRSIE